MNELQAVVAAWGNLKCAGHGAMLATVVRTSGSTYRRAGARMLFTKEGRVAGSISGGCLESDMVQTAHARIQHGPALVTYDSTASEDIVWGFGLGCEGVVEVLLERLEAGRDNDALIFIRQCLEERRPGVIATVLRVTGERGERVGQRWLFTQDGTCRNMQGENALFERVCADAENVRQNGSPAVHLYTFANGSVEVGFEHIAPPSPLVIFGAGHDALPVANLAKQMGWHVTVVDPRALPATPARFMGVDSVIGCTPDAVPTRVPLDAQAFTLLMTHNFLHDADLLAYLVVSPARYIGVLGPRRRLLRLLAHIEQEGIVPTPEQTARLYGPVGLDIGADNPDEIALSILAEMQAVATGRVGIALRDRQAPLHAETLASSLRPNGQHSGEGFVCGLT